MPLKGPAVQKAAANDAGDISWKVPMVKFYFPGNIPNINFHHWAAGVPLATSIAHKGALAGAKVMAAAIVECLKNPAIVAEAKRTFKEELGGVEYRSLAAGRPEAAGRPQPRDDGEIPAADGGALSEGEAGVPLIRLRAFDLRSGRSAKSTAEAVIRRLLRAAGNVHIWSNAIRRHCRRHLSDGSLSAAGELGCLSSGRGHAMRRRTFIAGFGSSLLWADRVRAQQPTVPVIGFLSSGSPDRVRPLQNAFLRGLSDAGYVESQNVTIENRWAGGEFTRLPQLAADLVSRRVSLIAAVGGAASARAAMTATATIPVVFVGGPDPVAEGLVSSLNRPSGNLTGVGLNTSELMPKRLQVLLELMPGAKKIGLLMYRQGVGAAALEQDVEAAIHTLGRQMVLLRTNSPNDLEAAFSSAAEQKVDALLVTSSAMFMDRRAEIVALAARHRLPAAYAWREFVEAGGLISYGPPIAWAYRQVGQYAGRILKGEKVADLPVILPTTFELVINLKTAKALGVAVPPNTLAVADEVIE